MTKTEGLRVSGSSRVVRDGWRISGTCSLEGVAGSDGATGSMWTGELLKGTNVV